MDVLTIAMGVFIGVFILPIVAFLILGLIALVILLIVGAFLLVAAMLQPVINFIVDLFLYSIGSNKEDYFSENRNCFQCKKSFVFFDFDDGDRNKHCSYDCHEITHQYEFKRSMIITAIILALFLSSL